MTINSHEIGNLPASDGIMPQAELLELIKSASEAYFPEFCECANNMSSDPIPCSHIDDANSDIYRGLAEKEYSHHAVEPQKQQFSSEPHSSSRSKDGGDMCLWDKAVDLKNMLFSPADVPVLHSNTVDFHKVRKDFPILSDTVNGKPLIWFDNAATTQKPRCVIERLKYFYEHENSNVHRGAHTLSRRATDAFEEAREKAAAFLNAANINEIVFVRGTTEAVNLVAQTYGLKYLGPNDEILVTHLEHHANIVPWQLTAAKTGAKLRVIPVDGGGEIRLSDYANMLSKKTKIVAVTHASNAIGVVSPVAQMTQMAHGYGAKVFVDGAQAVAHFQADVQQLGCDFYAFSGHKVFGPTGIGVLYAKAEILEDLPPYQGGGSMIEDVTFERSTYKAPPHRFEAGTANIADAIALGSALEYVARIGLQSITAYEHGLRDHAIAALKTVPGLRFIGKQLTGIISFVIDGMVTQDIGKYMDSQGIAVRTGHHCAMPILRRLGVESTVRASLAFYNTRQEIDKMVSALHRLTDTRHFIQF